MGQVTGGCLRVVELIFPVASMPKKAKNLHVCPVCEQKFLSEPPRSPKTGAGSLEICPCCGFQHGVDDDDRGITYAQARAAWRQAGSKWFSSAQKPPKNWGKN